MDANQDAFDILFAYLDAQGAPQDVRDAVNGLHDRWKLGREMNNIRLEKWRAAERELAELKKNA